MEMATGNSVLNTGRGRRQLRMLEGDAVETKCIIKRRRKDSSGVVLRSNDLPSDNQQQQQSQGDQTRPTATTVKRSSRFRGVSRHRWTGRFEAHLWDKGSWNPTQRKKGKQVYLGAYDEEESAARAYDLAAIKYWGTSTFTNFPVSEYANEVEIMKNVTREEHLASLRRRSSGFSRGVSKYRGVARHHHNGRWEARIGRVFGNKYLYLGTYGTQEEAAHAYDIAAIEYRGVNAVTNFDLSTYIRWLKPEGNPGTQESKSALGPLLVSTFPDHIASKKINHLSDLHTDPYIIDDLNMSKKQGISQRNAPISPCTKTSQSALGLLLKSSVFKELVEKNLNTTEEESEENEVKNFTMTGNNSEVGETFFNGISHDSYMCPSNGETILPRLEPKEENTLPLYSNLGQSLWNGTISMPSFLLYN